MVRIADLRLALEDLLQTQRRNHLLLTPSGRAYAPRLDRTLTDILSLPGAALDSGTPLAEALGHVDARHDGFGAALWHLCHAYLALPDAPPEVRAAAERIVAAFVPERRELTASYATEAARARTHRPKLTELATDLALLPVSGGDTAATWASEFVAAGDGIDDLLSGRATIMAESTGVSGAQAGALRSRALGVVNRARAAIRDDIEDDPTLPRNLDALIFGYLDLLDRRPAGGPRPAPPALPT